MKVAILLLAAGRGTRLGAAVPKAFLPLGNLPLLLHSAARLVTAVPEECAFELVVLVGPGDREQHLQPFVAPLQRLVRAPSDLHIVTGGETRQESMTNGLAATSSDCDLVLIHDAARALVSVDATRACLQTAESVGAALLAIPATDTLKRVVNGRVQTTVDRSEIYYAQTPQIARRELLLEAAGLAEADGFEATDDVSLLEHFGSEVAVVPGSATNLKITHPDDLPLAAALLAQNPTPPLPPS
ncbi:MAG: 2-C-methyl-D-erythritol 4-phosphate cytidylyltransferase [Planctomycetota bacterium]